MGFGNLFRSVTYNGGWKKSLLTYCRTDDLKFGKLIGQDSMGNSYYENTYYFLGRDRWVIYSDRFGYDYDASQVDRNWFRWLHHMTDTPPTEEDIPCYPWMLPHTENQTGTKDEYVPYSTTKEKIIPWQPPRLCPTRK